MVKLFLFPTRRSEAVLFFVHFLECCIERHTVLNHQPLLHPDATFVGFSRCMLSNVDTFRVITTSKLSVEITRDDRSMVFVTVILIVSVILSTNVDPSLMASDRGSNHSFAD